MSAILAIILTAAFSAPIAIAANKSKPATHAEETTQEKCEKLIGEVKPQSTPKQRTEYCRIAGDKYLTIIKNELEETEK
jgi:hypothetical protein